MFNELETPTIVDKFSSDLQVKVVVVQSLTTLSLKLKELYQFEPDVLGLTKAIEPEAVTV
jgi:hypothetical protein